MLTRLKRSLKVRVNISRAKLLDSLDKKLTFIVVPFRQAIERPVPMNPNERNTHNGSGKPTRLCPACRELHAQGSCSLKTAGKEFCPLCGLAHYGHGRICPNIKSETQINAMLNALKESTESKPLVEAATKYLRGVKSKLVQQRKRKEKEAEILANANPNEIPK